ncbi:sigma-54-dependent transcriptional regulator [Glaciecola siphonariae]|uniref:Sigma-54-dependent transcriptional regulator n=1 Tax=Glaciecola siphonariae TaxID=521012 RepID=A0ABV9LXA3_9ALTE
MKSILLIDDDQEFTQVMSRIIEHLGHHVSISDSVKDAKEWLALNEFDHILIDFMLPDGNGLQIFNHVQKQKKIPRVTFITGKSDIKSIIAPIAGPSVNYLIKPIQREDIESVLHPRRAAKQQNAQAAQQTGNSASKQDVKQANIHHHFDVLIGESAPMQALYKMIERVARSGANVMLMGESGVGKELVAQAIHNAANPKGDLIATNCGGFSKELIGSELFGHEKGAFTGAVAQKPGVFERANQGTLFLDEVTEMPLDMQPNLLRVLETKRVCRVGGTQEMPVDCRVISATNRTLEDIARENILREDIYFRLAVFPISIPSLKERKDDIPLLAKAFVEQLNHEHGEAFSLSNKQIERLCQHDWPGNVRELRHSIHRAFIMSEPGKKALELPDSFDSPFSQNHQQKGSIAAGKTIEELEKELIYATLAKVDNNKTLAAEMLGISTKTLYNRLHAYGDEL